MIQTPELDSLHNEIALQPATKTLGKSRRNCAAVCVAHCCVMLASVAAHAAELEPHTFMNPICEQADPWIVQDGGRYLACFSEGNRAISIHVSDRLTHIGPKHIVWTAPATGPASREVWAPELHKLDGRWYIYFAASDGQNQNHKAWVLQSATADPLGPYSLHGPLYTGDDPKMTVSNCWAIDLTVLELEGRRYALWSGWPVGRDIQYLYIAPMKDPLTLAAPRTRICANDDFAWERVDERLTERGLNEAPEVLQRDSRTFVTYSCSASWQPYYKLGMLELRTGGDPLNPEDWKKHSAPAFQSFGKTFGVGHNSFVKSPDGTEDWLVYHAKRDRADGWRRVVFAQPFKWDATGLPDFGNPAQPGQALPLPAGEKNPTVGGAQNFQFKSPDDLAPWSYFGHHQRMWLRDGRLHLGGPQSEEINGFGAGEKIVVDGGCWTNFSATVHMNLLENKGQMGLLFRVGMSTVGYDAQRGYFAGLASSNSVVLGWTDGAAWHEIASVPVTEPLPNEVEFSVTARGEAIRVAVDGKTVIETNNATFASGSIGLRTVDTHGAFSTLKIEPMTENLQPASKRLTYVNPVYPALMPDPSVIRVGDYYYAAGTTSEERLPDGRIFTLLRSRNLADWENLGGALTPPFAQTSRPYWAPELAMNNGKYYLYYCTGEQEAEKFGLRVASSNRPEGPYADLGVQLLDCESNRFTIDPFPFRDDDGKWYLFYARNFTNSTPGVHPGTAIVVDRMLDMTHLAGDCRTVTRAKHDWTLYEAHRRMEVYDQTFDWHTIEGPCVIKRGGRYYCFYSGANWQTPRYGVDYVVSDNPLGPYSDGGDHARVLHGIAGHVRGPGHHSIVVGPDGHTDYVLYHAWDPAMKERQLCLDKLQWTANGPLCEPSDTPQPSP